MDLGFDISIRFATRTKEVQNKPVINIRGGRDPMIQHKY